MVMAAGLVSKKVGRLGIFERKPQFILSGELAISAYSRASTYLSSTLLEGAINKIVAPQCLLEALICII